MKKCPFCTELIQDDAIKCRFCGEFLSNSESKKSPVAPVNQIQPSLKPSSSPIPSSTVSSVYFVLFLLSAVFSIVIYAILSSQRPTFPYASIVVTVFSALIIIFSIMNRKTNKRRYSSLLVFSIPFLIVGILCTNVGFNNYKDNMKAERAAKAAAIEKQKQLEAEEAKRREETKYNQEHKEEHYQKAIALLRENRYAEAREMLGKIASVDENFKDTKTLLSDIYKIMRKAEDDRLIAQTNQDINAAEILISSKKCSDFNTAIQKSESVLRAVPSSTKAKEVLLRAKLKLLSCYETGSEIQMAIEIINYEPLKLRVWINNVSNEVRHANPMYFTLVTVDDRSFSVSTESYGSYDHFDAVELQPGTETSGTIIFDTYTKPKRLVYNEMLGTRISRDFPFE
jgi:hypothetical protein